MKLNCLLAAACLLSGSVASATSATFGKFKTTCVGPSKANVGLIFLHGLQPTEQKIRDDSNRLAVIKFAETIKLRLAIVDSELKCQRFGESTYCWPARTSSETQQLWTSVQEHARSCFNTTQQKNYLVLGFSNGGYFAAKTILEPAAQPPLAVWAFGIGQIPQLVKAKTIPWLQRGTLFLSVGDNDIERKKTEQFARDLINLYPNSIRFMPFDGGHEVRLKVMLEQWKSVAEHLNIKI